MDMKIETGMVVISTEEYNKLRDENTILLRLWSEEKTVARKIKDYVEQKLKEGRKQNLSNGLTHISVTGFIDLEDYCELMNISAEHFTEMLDAEIIGEKETEDGE